MGIKQIQESRLKCQDFIPDTCGLILDTTWNLDLKLETEL